MVLFFIGISLVFRVFPTHAHDLPPLMCPHLEFFWARNTIVTIGGDHNGDGYVRVKDISGTDTFLD